MPEAPEPLEIPAFDSHCHLDILESPVERVVAEAQAVGIKSVVTIGTDLESSRWSASTAQSHEDVWAAVAIHPNEAGQRADSGTRAALVEIERLAGLPEVRAVGETGLDFYRDWVDAEDQRFSFRAHIDIAKRTGKALVIHDRDAHDDVLRILAEEGPPERVVFHCFSGDERMARVCADSGYYMSFAGNITFKNAADLRAAARVVPVDLLLVETDAPFLTPVPHRGRPNAPRLIPFTARALAKLKDVAVDTLCQAITTNGKHVFQW